MVKKYLDDGAVESVESRPMRPKRNVAELTTVVKGKPNNGLAALIEAGKPRNFIQMRSQKGVIKLSMLHAPLFAILVRLSLQNRADGGDGGVKLAELVKLHEGFRVTTMLNLDSMAKNGVLTSVKVYRGLNYTTTYYYPTPEGKFLFALAEQLGPGVQITMGGLQDGWRSRDLTEPPNLFDYVRLLSRTGGTSTVGKDLEENGDDVLDLPEIKP